MRLNSFVLLSIDNVSTDESLREVFIGNGAVEELRNYIRKFIIDRIENGKYRSKIEMSDRLDADEKEMSVSAFLEDDSPWYRSTNVEYLRDYISEYLKMNPSRFDIPDNYVMALFNFRIAEYEFEIETKGLGYLCDFE